MSVSLQSEAFQNQNTRKSAKIPLFILLFAGALALRIFLFIHTQYTVDDAFITFRYAENLAAGKGFVYNEGQKVLGTTTPIFTLILFTLLKLSIPCAAGAFVISAAADLITALVLLKFFENQRPLFMWLPVILFLYNPETLQWALSGMETQAIIASVFASFYFASRQKWNFAFLIAAAAVLFRIDGLAVPGALTVCYLIQHGRIPVQGWILFAALISPWFTFAAVYFGSPLPNSVAAKIALSGGAQLSAGSSLEILLRGFLHLHGFGVPLFLVSIAGTYDIYQNRKEWLPLAVWTWGYALSYTIASGPMHPWYYAPFYAGYLAISIAGLAFFAKHSNFLKRAPVQAAITTSAIVIVLYLSYIKSNEIQAEAAHLQAVNGETGRWMMKHTQPGSVIAIKDIGYIGYYSRRPVLDLAGLVSPECIPYRARNDFVGPIVKFSPDYFAFSEGQLKNLPLYESQLLKRYAVATRISSRWGSYVIFERVK